MPCRRCCGSAAQPVCPASAAADQGIGRAFAHALGGTEADAAMLVMMNDDSRADAAATCIKLASLSLSFVDSLLLQRRHSFSPVCDAPAGAGQGIGRAFAHALGEAGAAVAVVDVNKTTAEQVVKELSGKGVRSIAVQADVTKKADCKR